MTELDPDQHRVPPEWQSAVDRILGRVLADAASERCTNPPQFGISAMEYCLSLNMHLGRAAQGAFEEQDGIQMGDREAIKKARAAMRMEFADLAAGAMDAMAMLDATICRACGCTEEDPCPEGCYWAEPGLCSACKEGDSDGDGSAAV